jgi:hypothetical protein
MSVYHMMLPLYHDLAAATKGLCVLATIGQARNHAARAFERRSAIRVIGPHGRITGSSGRSNQRRNFADPRDYRSGQDSFDNSALARRATMA